MNLYSIYPHIHLLLFLFQMLNKLQTTSCSKVNVASTKKNTIPIFKNASLMPVPPRYKFLPKRLSGMAPYSILEIIIVTITS